MKRIMLGVVLAGLMGVAWVAAQPGVVRTTEGVTYEGNITEEDGQVIVERRGIRTVLSANQVDSIEYTGDLAERIAARRAQLADNDVQGRIALARWAFDRRDYASSREILLEAEELEPNNREVRELLQAVTLQIRLERRNADGPPRDEPVDEPENGDEENGETPVRTVPVPLLNEVQINRIKQFELRPNENPRIRFENQVDRRFANAAGIPFRDFNRLSRTQQMDRIIAHDPTWRDDIIITTEPAAIQTYRQQVQRMIVRNCGTCHGPDSETNFRMVVPGEGEHAAYTNFYILSTYVQEGAGGEGDIFAGAGRMINRVQPNQSLLIQYGLPREMAEAKHPDVPDFRPMLRNRTDPLFNQLQAWIGTSLAPVVPDYGIEFEGLPGPQERPATEIPQTQESPDAAPRPPADE